MEQMWNWLQASGLAAVVEKGVEQEDRGEGTLTGVEKNRMGLVFIC
jgi:hypothetical protein